MAKIKNPFKIGLYIRVSTEEQALNPEGSIKNQEERLRQAVDYKNIHSDFGKICGVYTDAGISAKDMKWPQLQELLKAIRNREIDLVMVTELSRLSRNSRDFIEMWDMMRAYGCRFQSLREDFDTTNAAGELVLFQLMNLAQFERRQVSERVGASVAIRSERGLYNGGPVPIGYKLIPERPGYLDIDEKMAALVRTAFDTFLREGCLSHAALWLNSQGYELKKHMEGGGRFQRVGQFTIDNLQTMLRNKVYIGIKSFTVKGEKKEVKAVWEPIIHEMTFKRAGEVLDKNRRRLKPFKNGRMPYLFSGITYCMTCGSVMCGKTATGATKKVGYYEHGWATKRNSTLTKKIFKCDPHRVPSKILEPAVWEKVLLFATSEPFAHRIFEKVQAHHKENPLLKDIERAKAKLYGINTQIEALSERIAELPKEVSAEPLYRQLARLQAMQKELEQQLTELKRNGKSSLNRIASLETFQEFSKYYKKLLAKELNVPEKKQLIQKFVKKLEVGTKSYKLHFIVDEEHFKRELALQKASSAPSDGSVSELRVFLKDYSSNTLTNGEPSIPMSELLYPIDSIEFSLKDPTRFSSETAEFYRKGRSLRDIAKELGCSKSKVRNDLKKAGVQVRESLSQPTHRRKINSGKQKALPYYGFCYFEGKIVPDPREFPTLTLINRLLKEKKTTHQITLELNSRKIKSRMGREWSWAAVQNIIDRFKKKKIILHGKGRFEFG